MLSTSCQLNKPIRASLRKGTQSTALLLVDLAMDQNYKHLFQSGFRGQTRSSVQYRQINSQQGNIHSSFEKKVIVCIASKYFISVSTVQPMEFQCNKTILVELQLTPPHCYESCIQFSTKLAKIQNHANKFSFVQVAFLVHISRVNLEKHGSNVNTVR